MKTFNCLEDQELRSGIKEYRCTDPMREAFGLMTM